MVEQAVCRAFVGTNRNVVARGQEKLDFVVYALVLGVVIQASWFQDSHRCSQIDKFCCSIPALLTLCLRVYTVDQSIFRLSDEELLHGNKDVKKERCRETSY